MGHLDLEATEMTVRAAMHRVGGVLLGEILNADGGGHRGTEIDCGRGHRARFVDYRTKSLVTVLAPVSLRRAYYHCEPCGAGVIPKDVELDVSATSFSPGVRRMMGRVGAQMPFDSGRQQIEDLAGVIVTTKEVERVAEGVGEQLETGASREREAVLSGKVVSIEAPTKLYIAMDGTGVPMVGRETAGRTAKEGNGQAKTREAKLGCVFTQTRLDERCQQCEVCAVDDDGHDQEAQSLVAHVPALVPERPDAVPRVVVRDGDEEGSRRRKAIVEVRPVEEQRVHGEVDDVAAGPDDAELRELLPVVAAAKRLRRARAKRRRHGCRLLIHRAAA